MEIKDIAFWGILLCFFTGNALAGFWLIVLVILFLD